MAGSADISWFNTFDPNSISGLVLWLSADSIPGLLNGEPVSVWNDKSSSLNNAYNIGSLRPTYQTNVVNGLPVVRFGGSPQYLIMTSAVSSVLPFSIFHVYKKRVSGGLMFTLTNSSDNNSYTMFDYSDGNLYNFTRGNAFGNAAGKGNVTSFWIGSQISNTGTNNVTGYKNGVDVSFSYAGGGSGTLVNYDWLGHRTTEYADGDLAEILFYNSALSTTDRQNVENYLNKKYAIF